MVLKTSENIMRVMQSTFLLCCTHKCKKQDKQKKGTEIQAQKIDFIILESIDSWQE